MCLSANLRPFVAITMDGAPHARVIVEVSRELSLFEPIISIKPGFSVRAGEPGVLDGGPIDVARLTENLWAAVDVVSVAVGDLRCSYSEMQMKTTIANDRYSDAQWSLVDVAYLQKEPGFRPYIEPAGQSQSPIHAYLPASRSFRDYPSRTTEVRELLDQVGGHTVPGPTVIVIKAPQGYGKSLLALQLASAADHNAGWFLAANDRRTLISSLARAERTERGVARTDIEAGGEKPDVGEDESLAAFALARLRDSLAPWVVVLDNNDQDPREPKTGIWNLLPVPRVDGQTLIVTTTHDAWPPLARDKGWYLPKLKPLSADDLQALGLPVEIDDVVAGRPLIAESLAELMGAGARIPLNSDLDGPSLMWSLFRKVTKNPEAVRVARTLAWCPPEGIQMACVPGVKQSGSDCCTALIRTGLVTAQGHGRTQEVNMHRLVAAAIRAQTWCDDSVQAQEAIQRVVLDEEGRLLLLQASDEAALLTLEKSEVGLAADLQSQMSGRLWHALGHIRERRGPVALSASHFREALKSLQVDADAEAYAESLMGIARATYQASNDLALLREAGVQGARAGGLLEPPKSPNSKQMREQANALGLLIQQKITESERDVAKRLDRLLEIRDGLWESYEARRAMARPAASPSPKSPPTREDGLESERAFYNLAGINLQIAKTSNAIDPTDSRVDEAFEEATNVYEVVRDLRQSRYAGRPHAHLASCVHGLAIVTYYRALFGRPDADLISALQIASDAMTQRAAIAVGLYGARGAAVHDTDVGKSVAFLIKVSLLADATRVDATRNSGRAHALRVVAEALEEYDGSRN
jgi:hypothetical protein